MNWSESNTILWIGNSYSPKEFIAFLKDCLSQSIEQWEKDILIFSLEWMNEEKIEFSIQTSGSTGESKAIKLSRNQMLESALVTGEYLNLKLGDKALLVLPAQFIAGKMMIVRALVLGLDLYYLPPKINVLEISDQEYAFTALIPPQIQYAIDHQLDLQIEKLGKVIIGGATLSRAYRKKIKELSSEFYATYGMTETITHIAMKRLNGPRIEEYFQCLPGISVDRDENDCLRIFSERLPSEITYTNDRVKLISDQSFEVLGRVDFVINSGGLKIQPEEIEEKLRSLLNYEFMISYRDDLMLGQKLVLIIEAQEAQVDQLNLHQNMAELLPKNKMPKEIVFVPKLIRTPNHKLDRLRNVLLIK